MKIITKEEEQDHYNETIKGGLLGGSIGLAAAAGGVALGSARFPVVRHLTLPMKAFLVSSGGTFAAIIMADRYSRAFEKQRNPAYMDEQERLQDAIREQQTLSQRAKSWGKEHRYQLVGGSWVASIAGSFALVSRNPYLSTAQKIVQARVYAQGFTLLVMVALAAFELGDKNKGSGRWETVKVLDPEDPEHKRIIEKKVHVEAYEGEDMWKDMVQAEERKLAHRKELAKQIEKEHAKNSEDKPVQQTKKGQKAKEESK